MRNNQRYVKPAMEVMRLDAVMSLLDNVHLSGAGDDNGEGVAEGKERPSWGDGYRFGDLWGGNGDKE